MMVKSGVHLGKHRVGHGETRVQLNRALQHLSCQPVVTLYVTGPPIPFPEKVRLVGLHVVGRAPRDRAPLGFEEFCLQLIDHPL